MYYLIHDQSPEDILTGQRLNPRVTVMDAVSSSLITRTTVMNCHNVIQCDTLLVSIFVLLIIVCINKTALVEIQIKNFTPTLSNNEQAVNSKGVFEDLFSFSHCREVVRLLQNT